MLTVNQLNLSSGIPVLPEISFFLSRFRLTINPQTLKAQENLISTFLIGKNKAIGLSVLRYCKVKSYSLDRKKFKVLDFADNATKNAFD